MKKLRKLLAVVTALASAVSMLGMVTVAEDDEYVFTIYINSIEDFLTFADVEDADNDGQIYEETIYILNIDIDFSEFTSVQEYYADVSFPFFQVQERDLQGYLMVMVIPFTIIISTHQAVMSACLPL